MKVVTCKAEIEYDPRPSTSEYHHNMHYCGQRCVAIDHLHQCVDCDFVWGRSK